MNAHHSPHNHIAIIGTGFGAIATAVSLQQAGFEDIALIERATDVGGVWRDNSYPGAAVDIKSHLYSLSFAPNPGWQSLFAKQSELHAYLTRVIDLFDLRRRLVLGCEVQEMCWSETEQHWTLETSHGPRTAQHVVVATGALAEPVVPELPGLTDFRGARFHSARWDHSFDLTDKRVAVIGTGASAIQFVPAIQGVVRHLTVFQRTPPWILPRHDREIPLRTQERFRAIPLLQRWARARIYLRTEAILVAFKHPSLMRVPQRAALKHLRAHVTDPVLRTKLTPNYRLGCKRVLISDDYLPALTAPNVVVNTDGIREVTQHGVIDNTGVEHSVDAIIFGTGFDTCGLPLTDRIYDSNRVTMGDAWGGNPTAYLGTTVAGYPNCFLIHGPNTGTGHSSVLHLFESQAKYVTAAVSYTSANGLASVEPTRAAEAAYTAEVDRMSEGTVWTSGGCDSWYLNENGRNVNVWPGSLFDFRRRTMRFRPTAHLVRRRAPAHAAVTA